jgi:hypothetical protein
MSFCADVGPESLEALSDRRDDARHQRPKPAPDRVSAFLPNEATASSDTPILPNEATASSDAPILPNEATAIAETRFRENEPNCQNGSRHQIILSTTSYDR